MAEAVRMLRHIAVDGWVPQQCGRCGTIISYDDGAFMNGDVIEVRSGGAPPQFIHSQAHVATDASPNDWPLHFSDGVEFIPKCAPDDGRTDG